jgi:hypothetical protein
MSRKSQTHIAVLLDESGSMSGSEEDVIGGTNNFIGEQAGEVEVTVYKFGTHLGPAPKRVTGPKKAGRIRLMKDGDYNPSGMTNLLDAVGYTIGELDKRVGVNDVGVCFIFTDGLENASVEFNRKKTQNLIGKRKRKGWLFLFAGADLDDFSDADFMGVAQSSRVSMSRANLARDMTDMSTRVAAYESAARGRRNQNMVFDADALFDQVTGDKHSEN